MGRRRLSSEGVTDKEEEGRRESLRCKKRIRYNYDTECEDIQDEDTEEDSEESDPSDDQKAKENHVLPVECGKIKGSLDKEKYRNDEECIQCEGQWFRPHKFEDFCGRGSSKKWKATIYYKNKPLQYWIDQGLLRRGKGMTKKKTRSSNHICVISSEESEQPTEDSENEDDDEEDRGQSRLQFSLKKNREEERERAEDVGGDSREDESEGKENTENGETEGRGTEVQKAMNRERLIDKEAVVRVKRLQEAHQDSPPESTEASLPESVCGPQEEEQNNADRNLTTPTPEDLSDTAEARIIVPIAAICMEDEDTPEDLSQHTEREQEKQEVRRTVAVSFSPQPAVDNTPEIQNETQERGSEPVPSTSCNLDTMDLNQLKREKIKMQLKVLKLQEEYYSLKLKERKQERRSKVSLV